MKRLAVVLLLSLACGGGPKSPDLLTRDLPSNAVDPRAVSSTVGVPDAGGGILDAGCCAVPFALQAMAGEISARLMFPAQSFDMGQDDAGVWRVTACVDPRADVFYFKVGYPTDDDAGVLEVDRLNYDLPIDSSGSVAPEVNVFDGADGGVCSTIEAGRYATLPDAG